MSNKNSQGPFCPLKRPNHAVMHLGPADPGPAKLFPCFLRVPQCFLQRVLKSSPAKQTSHPLSTPHLILTSRGHQLELRGDAEDIHCAKNCVLARDAAHSQAVPAPAPPLPWACSKWPTNKALVSNTRRNVSSLTFFFFKHHVTCVLDTKPCFLWYSISTRLGCI